MKVRPWELTEEKTFNSASTRNAMAKQARRKHLRVVQDQEIPWLKEVGDLHESRVFDAIAVPSQHKQTRRSPYVWRFLGDQLIGKIEIKVGDVHPIRISPQQKRRGREQRSFTL